MTDQEILKAMQEMLEPIKTDISGIKVLLDAEIRRDINLLAEGHQTILDKLLDTEELETMEARLAAVEMVVRKHSKEIQGLKKAQ